MTLSPSPNKSKYHYRRALKLTAVILVVILVFRWKYNRQPAPVVYTAAVKNEWGEEDILTDEGGEEKDSLATVHIYDREEEEGNIESQVNEGSMTPSHLGENSSGSTQINIPSFSDYYEDDRKAVDLNPVVEEDSAEEDGFFGNIFSIFQGKEESEEEDIYPESSSEGKMKTENATEASADVAKPQDGMTVHNQSSVAEHSQNTTGETGGAQDSEGEAEASTKTNATEVEGDVSKTPADIQPSIVSVTEKMIVENADVVKTSNDTEIATEVYNNSAPVDTNTEKVGENNAASDSQEKEAISQAQVIETTTEPQEKSETLENEPHKQTDVVEDSLGRLGDLISGIRDVVEELKKNKDTPQIDGEGGDTQYQQPEGTEGSIVNSKHEALKPGGKLHGHIDELLTLTAHLTDFLHESQGKGQEEKEDPATKANVEEFQHPDNQNQDTETQDTQLADPVASSTDPDQVKVLDVTPIETTTQDAGNRIPESALAPLEEKENPVNQTQEPANKWKETTSEQLDAAEVKDAVRRETESVLAVEVPAASERLEPETLLQNPEPYLQERNGLPVDPRIEAGTVQEAKIQENYTLQEQADGRIEPVAIIQEGEQVEPVVAGAEEGEQVEHTLHQQTGERIEPVNTVHESLIEGTDPAIKIQEHTTNMQEPVDEKAESLLAIKEPVSNAIDSVTNVEELVPQNQEQAGDGETNADREDNLSTVLANLKNMVHGLHSHIDNIRSKNPRNDTNEPENRIGEDQLQSQSSESNNQLMDQANESIQSQNQYLEPENQRYETGNQQEDQIKDQANNDINREVMKEGEGERETEREAATGEKPKPEDETIRNDATGEEGGRRIGENKPMENVEEKQPETHKEGEQIEEERVVEGVNVKGGEATWQEDRRRRLREACRSRNPETDESVNESLNRSLYIQRSHTLVCAVSKVIPLWFLLLVLCKCLSIYLYFVCVILLF